MKQRKADASLRLDESSLAAIQEDAKKQNASVNLAQSACASVRSVRSTDEKTLMTKLPASTFKCILETSTNETVAEAGKIFG
jgi:hypothetical protein